MRGVPWAEPGGQLCSWAWPPCIRDPPSSHLGGSLAGVGSVFRSWLSDGPAEPASPGPSVLAGKTGMMTTVSLSGGNASRQVFGVRGRANASSVLAALCPRCSTGFIWSHSFNPDNGPARRAPLSLSLFCRWGAQPAVASAAGGGAAVGISVVLLSCCWCRCRFGCERRCHRRWSDADGWLPVGTSFTYGDRLQRALPPGTMCEPTRPCSRSPCGGLEKPRAAREAVGGGGLPCQRALRAGLARRAVQGAPDCSWPPPPPFLLSPFC